MALDLSFQLKGQELQGYIAIFMEMQTYETWTWK